MISGNKGEWSELYACLKLLADGEIYAADENMEKIESLVFPILKILRDEKEQKLEYIVNGQIIIQDGTTKETIASIERSEFFKASEIVFENMKTQKGRSLKIEKFSNSEDLKDFLKHSVIENFKAKSTDKADITIQIHDQVTGSQPVLGFSIKSMLGGKSTLFNPGTGTNFIFSVEDKDLSEEEINDINVRTYEKANKIGERISEIENENARLVFHSIQSEKLELNLRLIDGDLPEILAYMLKIRYQTKKTSLDQLLVEMETRNPLEYNQRHSHPFYKYKLVKFLYDAALGMTPETVWNGDIAANGGIIIVKNDGEVLAYHTYHKSKFEEYLLNNTMLEQPSTSEDKNAPGRPQTKENYPGKSIKPFKFGWLYNEDDLVKLKICLQVRFSK